MTVECWGAAGRKSYTGRGGDGSVGSVGSDEVDEVDEVDRADRWGEVLSMQALPELRIRRVEAIFLSAPYEGARGSAFLTAVERAVCLLVRVEDADGAVGWGEAWCNFPRFGGPHRALLIRELVAPLLLREPVTDLPATFRRLSEATRVAAAQSGEPGPVAQAIAGVDMALWDLAARRAGQPLWRLLGGMSPVVEAYASLGWAPDVLPTVEGGLARGFRGFKLRTWGSAEAHLPTLAAARSAVGDDAALMVDANQSWPVEAAGAMARQLAPFQLAWLEEPLPVFASHAAWKRLTAESPVPLAAGENLRGEEEFEPYLASGACRVLQPDMAKWGGFSGGMALARRIRAAGLQFCPHYFGGGVGLLASAHLLAAAGGDGLLEYGISAALEPLRDELVPLPPLREGRLTLTEGPGLGAAPDAALVERYRVLPSE